MPVYTATYKFRWACPLINGGRPVYYRKGDEVVLPEGASPPPHCRDEKGNRTPGTGRASAAVRRAEERERKAKEAAAEQAKVKEAAEKREQRLQEENEALKARLAALESAKAPDKPQAPQGRKAKDPLA